MAAGKKKGKSKLFLITPLDAKGHGFGLRGLVWTLRIESFQCSVALEQAIQRSSDIRILGGLQAMAMQSHG